MSVSIDSRPLDISSAYLPVEYILTSTFVGVNGGFSSASLGVNGKTTIVITGIKRVGKIISVGGIITIENSDNYDGEHTVLQSSSDGSVLIDTDFISNDNGTIEFSKPNAHVLCDLYINGAFVVRRTRYPNINNQFIFDFSKELQINLGNDLNPVDLGANNPIISPESSALFHIEYIDAQDVITDGVTVTTLSGSLNTDAANAITAINSTVPYLEWLQGSTRNEIKSKDTNLNAFLVGSTSGARFLTNSPNNIDIGRNDSYQLSLIVDYDAAIDYKRHIQSFDASGAQITDKFFTFLPGNDSVWVIPSGTRDLAAIQVPAAAVTYTVSVVDANDSNAIISEAITFNIDDDCHQSKTRFVWLNPRGGYDAYNFHAPRKLNSNVSKGSFTKSAVHPTVVGNREDSIINVNATDSITTRTAKVSGEVAEWLQELLESPEVFIELDDDNVLHDKRVPVTILNKTRAISDSYNSLHTVSLRYSFGFSKTPIRAR